MGTTAPASAPGPSGGPTSPRRSRPLCRDYGGDPRSAELADSIAGHQRVISEHEGAMLREIAEFAGAETWRGDGSLSMPDWLVAHCHVSRSRARTLVEAAEKVGELPALSDALSEGRLTLDVFAPLAAVATPETDAELARASEHWTPKQARRLAAEVRGATASDSAAQFRRRFVRFDDGIGDKGVRNAPPPPRAAPRPLRFEKPELGQAHPSHCWSAGWGPRTPWSPCSRWFEVRVPMRPLRPH